MRKFLLAAAIGALASATAMAQNASPNDPANGTAGVNDRMNSSATQGGAAIGANPARGPRRTPQPRLSRAEGWAEFHPGAEHGHVELERRWARRL